VKRSKKYLVVISDFSYTSSMKNKDTELINPTEALVRELQKFGGVSVKWVNDPLNQLDGGYFLATGNVAALKDRIIPPRHTVEALGVTGLKGVPSYAVGFGIAQQWSDFGITLK